MSDEYIIANVRIPVPDDETPESFAERVSNWSVPTLASGIILNAQPDVADPEEYWPTWRVCHRCGQIIEPGELDGHTPDECITDLGAYRRHYTREGAERHQQDWIQRRRK